MKPLAIDYAFHYERLDAFFSGNRRSPDAWRKAIARTQAATHPRAGICKVLTAQQERRGASPTARASARALADGATVAILTGQQAGAFGGPLFTLLKALTAIRLAEQVT